MQSDVIQKGCVLAIGNFDGVHKGHQALLKNARKTADERDAPFGVLTFTPHPRRFFQPDLPPGRLTTDVQKQKLLKKHGCDFITFENFNTYMRDLTPQEFVDEILVKKYDPVCVIVGFNFYFGKARAGDAATLKAICADNGIYVIVVSPVQDAGENYSSSRARTAVRTGDFATAAAILGRPFQISGPVLHGDKRGREIGYPTANQSMSGYVRPPYGVYTVQARTIDGHLHNGVANLGIRPMFEVSEPLLETYLFDFNNDIYGQNLEVSLLKHLRGEKNFASLDALIVQIKKDEAAAHAYLETVK